MSHLDSIHRWPTCLKKGCCKDTRIQEWLDRYRSCLSHNIILPADTTFGWNGNGERNVGNILEGSRDTSKSLVLCLLASTYTATCLCVTRLRLAGRISTLSLRIGPYSSPISCWGARRLRFHFNRASFNVYQRVHELHAT